jgi:hypothetical protein
MVPFFFDARKKPLDARLHNTSKMIIAKRSAIHS